MPDYFVFNKPYGVICQFSPQDDKLTLADFLDVARDVYPVGRLDTDSEGLLLLTNDKSLTHQLLDPKHGHPRTYHVQVEGDVTSEAIDLLTNGVRINVDGNIYKTHKASVKKIDQPDYLWERNPPIRERKSVPVSWISITLTEGKNRQVRKMTAAIGFPTLRLIRFAIGKITIENLKNGEYKSIQKKEIGI